MELLVNRLILVSVGFAGIAHGAVTDGIVVALSPAMLTIVVSMVSAITLVQQLRNESKPGRPSAEEGLGHSFRLYFLVFIFGYRKCTRLYSNSLSPRERPAGAGW